MVRIILDNQQSRVVGKTQILHELHEAIKLKAPGYFFSPAYRKRVWDGYIRYITKTGMFQTGLLDMVTAELKKMGKKYIFEDRRDHFKDLKIVDKLGDLTLRGYQRDAVYATLNHQFEEEKFIRGILHEATNAGKNLIAAAIYASFSKNRRGLFLIDNTEIYRQAIEELEELLPGQIGQIQGKTVQWNRVTICMVQSLSNLVKKDRKAQIELSKQDIIIVDECDTTIRKRVCKNFLKYCLNAPIRIGLSGTPFSHKHKTVNLLVQSFFGPIIHTISNKELVEVGVSAKPFIRILQGNTKHIYPGDYKKEYRRGIIKSRERNQLIANIALKQLDKKRGPILILIKNHLHIKYLEREMPEYGLDGRALRIASVHHKTESRARIFELFKEGHINILIASMIIRRGKNLPTITTLINAAGGDSEANVLQILGRGLRKREGVKEKLWMYDFWDKGKYLRRHSYHRVIYYKKQGFPIKENYIK